MLHAQSMQLGTCNSVHAARSMLARSTTHSAHCSLSHRSLGPTLARPPPLAQSAHCLLSPLLAQPTARSAHAVRSTFARSTLSRPMLAFPTPFSFVLRSLCPCSQPTSQARDHKRQATRQSECRGRATHMRAAAQPRLIIANRSIHCNNLHVAQSKWHTCQ